jgi:uncharacterized protein (UPF0332 family)
MKKELLTKAKENIKAAELLFENRFYNASANRAYYAAFQSAIAALLDAGMEMDRITHEAAQAHFAKELIQKRKIYPNHLRAYLMDLQAVRNYADYELRFVSKKVAFRQLRRAEEFVDKVEQELKT